LLTFVASFISILASAQAPAITYPSPAQDITRAYNQSLLSVKLVFNGVCGGTVRLGLPPSVTYVPGSLVKVSGTSSVSISESAIIDLNKPEFSVSGVVSVGDEITFTVARRAACGLLTSGKDSVYFVAGAGCSDGSETSGTINTYNVFAPALSISNASSLTGVFIGDKYSRTFKVTNGGNGCLDTLWLAIVRDSAQNVTQGLYLDGTTTLIPSYRSNGDSIFYKIFGTNLPGSDALMCSGEEITFKDSLLIANCKATGSRFIASWGRSESSLCQTSVSTGVINTPAVVMSGTATSSTITPMEPCTKGTYRIQFANTTSVSGKGGALYNINAHLGNLDGGNPITRLRTSIWGSFSNFKVGTSTAVVSTGNMGDPSYVHEVIATSQFTSDPDGAGGLEDLDGDGQFDDLAPGNSFYVEVDRTFIPASLSSTSCPTNIDGALPVAILSYSNMCKNDRDTGIGTGFGGSIQTYGGISASKVPLSISDGGTFTVQFCNGRYGMDKYNWPGTTTMVDSMYLEVDLPAGLTYIPGTATYGGSSSGVSVSVVGTKLRLGVLTKSNNCFEADFLFTCGTAGTLTVPYSMYQVLDRTCNAINYLGCNSFSLSASCAVGSAACADGGAKNYPPSISRTSFGWTSTARTTLANPATLPAFSRTSATNFDTVNLKQSSVIGTVGLANLYYNFELARTSGSGDVLQFIDGTLFHKNVGTGTISSCTLPSPSLAGSTAGLQRFVFDFTSLMGGACGLPATFATGDSVWLSANFMVTAANNSQLFGTSNFVPIASTNAYFYNLSSASVPSYCGNGPVNLFLIGTSKGSSFMQDLNVDCSSSSMTIYPAGLFAGATPGVDYFPGEYRPGASLDSAIVDLPAGYDWVPPPGYGFRADTFLTVSSVGYINTSGSVVQTGNRVKVVFPSGQVFSDINTGDSWVRNILFLGNFTATCGANNPDTMRIYTYGRHYAYNPAASINFADTAVSYNPRFATTKAMTVQDLTGTVQGTKAQHYWDLKLNSTGTTTASYVWLAVEKGMGSGNITVDSVVLKPSNVIIPLTSVYNTTDRWYQISTAGIASGSSQDVRVYFKYSSCSLDSVLIRTGWDCAAYPTPNPSVDGCGAAQRYFRVDPQLSQVQSSVERQPGGGSSINLCTTDSAILLVNSAQSANLLNPTLTFYPPAGLSLVTPVRVEYPRGSGDYQNAAVTSLPGGGYLIDLSAHTTIGTSGILGTANANPSFSPLGGDREARVICSFTTSCDYSSGTSLRLNVYGNRTCGETAIGNGSATTTSALNITGATVLGSAGFAINFGGGPTSVNCGTSLITLSSLTTPTITGTVAGDTAVYTLPVGLGYVGGISAGFTALVSGGSGAPTIVKIPMPVGVAASVPISYSFDIAPEGGACGPMNITGVYQRQIASLMCGAIPCTSSRAVLASATSPTISVNKPNLVINNVALLDSPKWRIANFDANHVKVYYTNNGTQAYAANADTIEFFCTNTATTPFAKMPLNKSLAVGASDSSEYWIMMPLGSCLIGNVVTARIQTQTASGTNQCLCSPSTFEMLGVELPLNFLSTTVSVNSCAVTLDWRFNPNLKVKNFIIERSADGIRFDEIATVGDIQSFVDLTPIAGKWLYRIRTITKDGGSHYSGMLTAYTVRCSELSVSVFPNPSDKFVYAILQGSFEHATYRIYDAFGKQVGSGLLSANISNKIELASLTPGAYFLRIEVDGKSSIHSVNVVR
jgi:hypothetical protein